MAHSAGVSPASAWSRTDKIIDLCLRQIHRLIPAGLLMLAGGLLLHSFMHEGYSEFAGGLLIGMSLVFLIAGFAGSQRLSR